METRETAVSTSFSYATAECTHCGDEVFTDKEAKNVDELPKGVNVVLTGGKNMTVEKANFSAAAKNYRIPRVLVKLFARQNTSLDVSQSYLCPACAQSVYGFEVDR